MTGNYLAADGLAGIQNNFTPLRFFADIYFFHYQAICKVRLSF